MKEFNRDEYISECYAEPAHDVRRPHKHAELIKAWADGAEIECKDCGVWYYAKDPRWQEDMEYRIKPEQKSDIVKFIQTSLHDTDIARWDLSIEQFANLKIIFDGKTGKPKSAEVLK